MSFQVVYRLSCGFFKGLGDVQGVIKLTPLNFSFILGSLCNYLELKEKIVKNLVKFSDTRLRLPI